MMAAVTPAKGEIAYVCPAFEEARLRELITFGGDVRAWEEDESPYELVAGIFRDRGITSRRIGIEESVRFFLFDGIRKEAPHLEFVSADTVTIPCRSLKSPAEIALMQRAITLAGCRTTCAAKPKQWRGLTQRLSPPLALVGHLVRYSSKL